MQGVMAQEYREYLAALAFGSSHLDTAMGQKRPAPKGLSSEAPWQRRSACTGLIRNVLADDPSQRTSPYDGPPLQPASTAIALASTVQTATTEKKDKMPIFTTGNIPITSRIEDLDTGLTHDKT